MGDLTSMMPNTTGSHGQSFNMLKNEQDSRVVVVGNISNT